MNIILHDYFENVEGGGRQQSYYLSTGRLDKLKRVDLVVDAFRRMPAKKLVVVADGPELAMIKKMAQGVVAKRRNIS